MDTLRPRLLIDNRDSVPVGTQLKNQLKYMINSRELPGGSRLPPVRTLASRLGVAPGTVAQVYRELQLEGLVVGEQGRGTFVRSFSGDEASELFTRRQQLDAALAQAMKRAWSLGFSLPEIREQLRALYGARPPQPELATVFPLRRSAEVYAQRVQEVLCDLQPRIHAVELARLEAGQAEVLDVFRTAWYAVTLVQYVPQVQAALTASGIDGVALGVTAELAEGSAERLAQLDPAGRHVIFTEPRNVHTMLNVLDTYSDLDVQRVVRIPSDQPAALLEALPGADTILYSSGVEDLVASLELPAGKLLALEFRLTRESRDLLQGLFHVPQRQAVAI